jgi:hypothetical protein
MLDCAYIILEFTCTISLNWEMIWYVGFTPVLGGSHSPVENRGQFLVKTSQW